MNTKHKTRQWAPTELPPDARTRPCSRRSRRPSCQRPQVAARFQAEEEEFADHVAKTDPAMAKQVRSGARQKLRAMGEMERRHALHFQAAELYWVTRDMTRVALDASTDMPPWTPGDW